MTRILLSFLFLLVAVPAAFAQPTVSAVRIGAHPDTIRLTEADLWKSDGTPLDLDGPIHPDYAGDKR